MTGNYNVNIQINGSIIMYYADDTCTLFSDNIWDLVHRKASAELNHLLQKLNCKITTINYEKTVCITFLM